MRTSDIEVKMAILKSGHLKAKVFSSLFYVFLYILIHLQLVLQISVGLWRLLFKYTK